MAQSPESTPLRPIARRFHGCSKIDEYDIMSKLGEGTFGEVHKARQVRTGATVAMKKILMHNEKDGFPITALREIKLLKMLCHDNVLKLEEMAVERKKGAGRQRAILYMVTPYMDHDLSGLLDNPDVHFTEPQIKCYMLQLFKGLQYLHDNHILHRDMKAANLLINNRGRLQIADFGLARHYEEPVPRKGMGNGSAKRDYTQLVVTRWYRPPELLLSLRRYTPAIDMWGAGCVFGEMFKRKPILAGTSDLNQAHIIFELVGSPNDESMPGWRDLNGCEGVKQFPPNPNPKLTHVFRELGPYAISLLKALLTLDWRKRINAIDAIDHPYFKMEPKPMREEDIPRFADSHELDRRNTRGQRPLPPAPAGGAVGMPDWNGTGPPPTNGPWMNGDRRGGGPQDRGPPGVGPPPGGYNRGGSYDNRRGPYDHRGPPPPPPRHQHQPYRPDNRNQGLPYDDAPPRHALPHPPPEGRHPLPHPPPHNYAGPGIRGPPRHGDPGDRYVPRYDGSRDERDRHDRRSRESDDVRSRDGRRGSRDSGNSRDAQSMERGIPPSRDDRGAYRPPSRDDRAQGYRPPRDYGRDTKRSRTRSPDRERENQRERERVRDVYRR
ncbi:Pkinase-domain-containing protein [Mytilinidion resinicola]|uniref:Serine/threonine-protein kinase BUR1 n=1 Tax=Mytilinidion resinicola TaxID=574789 RepID=A0A6A6YQT1_9PEZI|nr:Pkinase-domain-containing protein [Mytilinidion resinicola]KAF2811266.1 Pkinase-domain-containing protein [Mytilinidion resinicola]